MIYSKELINILSDAFCPNDMFIEDCSKIYDCHVSGNCHKCWVKSLNQLNRSDTLKKRMGDE